jgi:nucleoid-associated protein YgaU
MDIYLTDLETGDRLRFPMLPQKITVQTGTIFESYTVMAIGEIKLPSGQELTGFSWQGMLPGEIRKKAPYVLEWRDPKEIQSLWSVYRAKKKKLRLLTTETPINHDVYLDRYTVEYSGGQGDYTYTIYLIQAKDLKVYPSGAGGESSSTAATAENKPLGEERPSPPPAQTHTVAKGDSLWALAEKLMGDGSRYPELYEANKDIIDARNKGTGNDKYTIYPGQTFSIPDPASGATPNASAPPKTAPNPGGGGNYTAERL